MQERWEKKFQKRLNEELDLEHMTPENDLIQKTLSRIYTAQPESNVLGKEKITKKKKHRLFKKMPAVAAAVLVIFILLPVMVQRVVGLFQMKKDSSGLMNGAGQPTSQITDNGKVSVQVNDAAMPESDITEDGEGISEEEKPEEFSSGLQEDFDDGAASKSKAEETQKENFCSERDNGIVLEQEEIQSFILTSLDGTQRTLSLEETAGTLLLSILSNVKEVKETAWLEEQTDSLIYTVSVVKKESEQEFLLYEQGQIVQIDEKTQEEVIYQTQEQETFEEFKKILKKN